MVKFLLSLFTVFTLFAADYSIVFIHIGGNIPFYSQDSIEQARLFNPGAKIILIGNQSALSQIAEPRTDVYYVSIESLEMTSEHAEFLQNCSHSPGLWKFSIERFLLLNDLMAKYNLSHVFHMENDIMLYSNLEELLPIFSQEYKGIAATFDNEGRCIPGFIYFSHKKFMKILARHMANNAGSVDMALIADFKNIFGDKYIRPLPIVCSSYSAFFPLISPAGHTTQNPEFYSRNFNLFQSVFDAAALGQYLGGIDPFYHGPSLPGFINESCLFNPSAMTYTWERDEEGRLVPYATFKDETYKINNLHIHCKDLKRFSSK